MAWPRGGSVQPMSFSTAMRVGDVVGERREVIQPVRVGHELVVVHVLGDLFVAAMQVADVRRGLGDDLAVHLQDEPQHAVRGRMRRPHVEDQLLAEQIGRGAGQLRGFCSARQRIRSFEFVRRESHESAAEERSLGR